MSLGSVETVAVRAALRVLENLHLYTSASPGLTQADLDFLNGFLFPVGVPYEPLLESESYNRYPELIPGLAKIYGSPDQPLLLIKRLAYLIDRLVQFPNLDKVLFNKLTIRLKFFASS